MDASDSIDRDVRRFTDRAQEAGPARRQPFFAVRGIDMPGNEIGGPKGLCLQGFLHTVDRDAYCLKAIQQALSLIHI